MSAAPAIDTEPRLTLVPNIPPRLPPRPEAITSPGMRRVPRVDPPEIAPAGTMNTDERVAKILDFSAATYDKMRRVEGGLADVRREVSHVKSDVVALRDDVTNLQGDVGAVTIRVERLENVPAPRPATHFISSNSMPPLPEPTKTGSFPKEVIEETWRKIEGQLSGLQQKLHDQEVKAAEAQRLQEVAEKRSARLLGWLALVVSALVMLGAAFAYLAPRLAQ